VSLDADFKPRKGTVRDADAWPFTEHGELKVSKQVFKIVTEIRLQRTSGVSLKRISKWLAEEHHIAMGPQALYRLLTASWPPIVIDERSA